MKTATYTIRGLTPLMMHSERLANPFDVLTRELKALTGKRTKTEDDLLDIARVEWMGGLYADDKDGIYLPGYNIFGALVGGGKLHKLGTALRRAAIINEERVVLDYEGPRDPAKLFADKRFVDMRSVKVGVNKVMRCRPVFRDWKASFSVLFDEAGIQRSDIDRCLSAAGSMVGLGDYRPRFGRFEVTEAH